MEQVHADLAEFSPKSMTPFGFAWSTIFLEMKYIDGFFWRPAGKKFLIFIFFIEVKSNLTKKKNLKNIGSWRSQSNPTGNKKASA
ncbi:MAG: hypothetical protein Ct9H300mP23_01080 [Nitrospinota bacterium]|nr:MAG: hypothetical protein Ct9H300mP23_01080 [Nitrospinota bacterium]